MRIFIYSFLISFFACGWLVFYARKHRLFLFDTFDGPQKFHTDITPRVGGFGIFLSSLICLIIYWIFDREPLYIKILFSSLPVFVVGFIEDITKKISPSIRLLSAAISGIIFIYFAGSYLVKLDIIVVDNLLEYRFFSILITVFAIAGVSNSINIIDGFNGLASVVSMLILISISYVAFKVNDIFIMRVSIIMIGSILGFFIWNYPFGKIFLGDGGAYFIGFIIAVLSIMLVVRNPVVSPWFPLLSSLYPVFETVFSIYRRKFVHRTDIGKPDSNHLHQLIYKRVVPVIFDIHRNNKLMKNSATSPFLWFICSFSVIPAVIFYDKKFFLMIFSIIFCVFYIFVYRSIVKFKIGKFFR